MKDFKSKRYAVLFGSGQGRGTFIIMRRQDEATTWRYVCSEGYTFYKKLKRAFRENRKRFDAICDEEFLTYDEQST